MEDDAAGYANHSHYNRNHRGVKLGDAPLLPMDPGATVPFIAELSCVLKKLGATMEESYIACSLHLVLRLTGNLYTWTVRANLVAPTTRETEARVDAVNAALRKLNICVRKATKPRKKEQINDAMGKQPSVNGAGCQALLEGGYKLMLDAVGLTGAKRQHAEQLWAALKELKDSILCIFDEPEDLFKTDPATLALRKEHADDIAAKAKAYKAAWLSWTHSPERCPMYIHIAEMQIPGMVMKVGSMSRWSMQGEEHLHSKRKLLRKTRTSHRKVAHVMWHV